MPSPLSDPALLRLLRSAQVALPVTQNPWADLAKGLSVSEGDLGRQWQALYDAGAAEGIWLEPNPAHPGHLEQLLVAVSEEALSAATGVRRWTARGEDGRAFASVLWDMPPSEEDLAPLPGVERITSHRWFKAGLLPDLSDGAPENLLAPRAERTLDAEAIVQVPKEGDPPELQAIWEALSRPRTLAPGRPFWDQLADSIQHNDPAALRQDVIALVLSKRSRRFALKPSLAALGWQRCGMACWSLPAEDAPKAAAALAKAGGVADLCLRQSLSSWPWNLCAVFLTREAGSGEAAARNVAEQWGRKLGKWISLEFR